ncbi:MAG: glycosyltransferase family 4 protein [Parcubacteria group bacterium]
MVPNYFDDSSIAVKDAKAGNQRFQAVYVGGVTYQKGAYEIVGISVSHPDINFTLIGPISNDFSQRFESLPANLRILPHMQNAEVQKELSKSDFFIFPSHSEGFPNAVLEAMVAGLPVIATNVGAIPEMIDEGKGGFLCEPKNVEQIKKAINNLLDNNLESMGAYNFNKAKNNYSYPIVIKKLCEIYQETLK